jgi:hypothetical protein
MAFEVDLLSIVVGPFDDSIKCYFILKKSRTPSVLQYLIKCVLRDNDRLGYQFLGGTSVFLWFLDALGILQGHGMF